MRFHTDSLTSLDIRNALADTGLSRDGVWIELLDHHRSRSHAHAYEIRLRADHGKDREGTTRRSPMFAWKTGDTSKAATYHEWGIFMAALYEKDPTAKWAGTYDNAADFHTKTRTEFA